MSAQPLGAHPADAHPLLALGDEPFVLLTTYRSTGVAVPTPVWVARDGDRLLVTTGATSGKVKRLGHTARVDLTACSARGAVIKGAVPVTAHATVATDVETLTRLDEVLLAKYGEQFSAVRAAPHGPGSATASVAIVITPTGSLPA